jgi:hypothetical protein
MLQYNTEGTPPLFKNTAKKVFMDVYEKWKDSFSAYKIFIDAAIEEADVIGDPVLKIIAFNVTTLRKFIIEVAEHHREGPEERGYFISLYVPADELHYFKKESINPVALKEQFEYFYNTIMMTETNEKLKNGAIFMFNEVGNIESINSTFTVYVNGTAEKATHSLYKLSDMDILRKNNLIRSGVSNYRNFSFLSDFTNIKEIINDTDHVKRYRTYLTDMQRFHSLIQMERI